MSKKDRLKEVLMKFAGTDPTMLQGFKAFDEGVAKLKDQLTENIKVSALSEVNSTIKSFQEKISLEPLLNSLSQIKDNVENLDANIRKELENRIVSLQNELATKTSTQETSSQYEELINEISTLQSKLTTLENKKPQEIPDFKKPIADVENRLIKLIDSIEKYDDKEIKKEITDLEEEIKKLRIDLVNRINERGGGSINQRIQVNGTTMSTRYADFNLKGAGITATDNDTTKQVDIDLTGLTTYATTTLNNLGTTAMNASLQWNNTAARTFNIAATATDVVGRALTISSGSTVAGTSVNNVVGGNLTLNSGLGTGTGASSIIFQTGKTLASGKTLQTLTTALTLAGDQSATFTGQINLAAGTTAIAPINFQAGTLKTNATAGDMNYDGVVHYSTHATGERGVALSEQFITLTSPYTLANQGTIQQLFNSTTNGALTLASSTSYFFECAFKITGMSATSGNAQFDVLGAGSATLTSVAFWASGADNSSPQGPNNFSGGWAAVKTSSTSITVGGTGTALIVYLTGIIRINAGGTIIPSVALFTAIDTAVVATDSWFRIRAIGSNTVTSVGNWS